MNFQNPLFWVILVIAGILGYFLRNFLATKGEGDVEQKIKKQLEEAKAKAAEIVLEAQEKSAGLIEEAKKDERARKIQLDRLEERYLSKDEAIEKEIGNLRIKESRLSENLENLKDKEAEIEELKKKIQLEVERIARLTPEEAKEIIFRKVSEEYQKDLALSVQKLEKERVEELEKKSLDILTTAIQRYSRSHVSEITTTILNLPN